MTRTLRVASGMVATGVLALVFTSCGGSHDDVQRAVVPTTPEMTAPVMTSIEATDATTSEEVTPLSDEEAIIAAVHGYWRVILEASSPPNPEFPDLENYMIGDARERAIAVLTERRDQNLAVEVPSHSVYTHEPRLETVNDSEARVSDCSVDDLILIDNENGVVIDDEVGTTLWSVDLLKSQGNWLVLRVEPVRDWVGVGQCDS